MERRLNPFYSTPTAILLASLIVSTAILIHGGYIKLGKSTHTNNTTNKQQTEATTPQANASAQPAAQKPTVTLDLVKANFNKAQIKFGQTDKKLVAVEIADPSCPYCQIAAGKNATLNKQAGSQFTLVSDGGSYIPPVPELKKLVDSGQASFAYIYYPGHGSGEMGVKALYCANDSGKFWEAHDLLMSSGGYDLLNNTVKNDKTKSQELANFLAPAVDPTALKNCLDSGKYDKRLQDDMALATSLGVSGTPGFYLNATPFAGAYSYKDMESAVKQALGS